MSINTEISISRNLKMSTVFKSYQCNELTSSRSNTREKLYSLMSELATHRWNIFNSKVLQKSSNIQNIHKNNAPQYLARSHSPVNRGVTSATQRQYSISQIRLASHLYIVTLLASAKQLLTPYVKPGSACYQNLFLRYTE